MKRRSFFASLAALAVTSMLKPFAAQSDQPRWVWLNGMWYWYTPWDNYTPDYRLINVFHEGSPDCYPSLLE
jgi:hypothetical protein